MKKFVKICDVTLQYSAQHLKSKTINYNHILTPSNKLYILDYLESARIDKFEIGSNKITKMKNTKEIVSMIDLMLPINLAIIVPSYNKYLELQNWKNIKRISNLSLIISCSSSFIKKILI